MTSEFQLLMISAMYENGGNVTHRLFDGHPQLYVYPFESQLGTRHVSDLLSSVYPAKYRWPEFPLQSSPEEDYEAIADEECKVRIKTPSASKFSQAQIDLSDQERKEAFVQYLRERQRSRARIVEAFFRATFEAWRGFRRSGSERMYVGYSPIVAVDAEKILGDFPSAQLLHVVRNPWSAYADTKKRPVPLSLAHYVTAWVLCQQLVLFYRSRSPGHVHLLRYEDAIENPEKVLGSFCSSIGLAPSHALSQPSWNGTPLAEVSPWGTIRKPTPQGNRKAAGELTTAEQEEIRERARPLLRELGYDKGF